MNSTSIEMCGICGLQPASTRDHLPPKSIFPKPRPDNLITVPSCIQCNQAASKDDEAFRLYLALHVGDFSDPLSRKYFEESLKSFRHNKRLQREILGNSEPVEFPEEKGIHSGDGLKVLWNSESHDAVISRITRGLYYHHFKEVVNPNAQVKTHWFHEPDEKFLLSISNFAHIEIGKKQFSYRYARHATYPFFSLWFFEFYGRHWAGAKTGNNLLPQNYSDPTMK